MRAYWLHTASWSRIVTQRVRHPESIAQRLVSRRRPDQAVPADGRLVLIDCNHTSDPRTNEPVDRRELLDRVVEALSVPEVDGVIASVDMLEELTLLNVLEHRLAFCTGAADPVASVSISGTGACDGVSIRTMAGCNFDGGVLSQRWKPSGLGSTSQARSVAVDVAELTAHGLPAIVSVHLEPEHGDEFDTSWSQWIEPLHTSTSALATGSGVWITLPAVSGLAHLAEATGFPVLMRDTSVPIQSRAWKSFFQAELPLTIRGMIPGASALFPLEGSVAEATSIISQAVRNHSSDPHTA